MPLGVSKQEVLQYVIDAYGEALAFGADYIIAAPG